MNRAQLLAILLLTALLVVAGSAAAIESWPDMFYRLTGCRWDGISCVWP